MNSRVEPGIEVAVCLEGTFAVAGGGSLLALYILVIGLLGGCTCVGIATLAAFLAKNEERLEWMTNEVVNFIKTVIGATIAISLCATCGFFLLISFFSLNVTSINHHFNSVSNHYRIFYIH